MSEAKHTKLPWIIKAVPNGYEIWDKTKRKPIAILITDTAILSQANAEFIIRAVNSHDALVHAYEWLVSWLYMPDGIHNPPPSRIPANILECIEKALATATEDL